MEHFFRHEYGRLVSIMSCRVGVQYVEDIEDAVQSALMQGLEVWPLKGVPDNPTGWLYRVAHNQLMGDLRQRAGRERILAERVVVEERDDDGLEVFLTGEVRDDLLRMLFACCDESLPDASQLVLALKILCGFDIREIALRLFTSEANVYKRLGRARKRLQSLPFELRALTAKEYAERLSGVHKILYLLFTEGYLSSRAEMAIRIELCEEAMRLAAILAEHPWGQASETFALLALMHLHFSRMNARRDTSGGLLLLEEQDRSRWNQGDIQQGMMWLGHAAQGDRFSRYHAEAGIAAEHCLAPSFAETRWERVAECYALLEQMAPSAIHKLNRAVAVAEWQGPAAGLAILEGFEPPTWLSGSYLWAAVLADLHRRLGRQADAQRYREIACELAPTPELKALLRRRLGSSSVGSQEDLGEDCGEI